MTSFKLLNAWRQTLELSRLAPGQAVVILLSPSTDPANVAAAKLTTGQLGARAVTIELAEAPTVRVAGESTAYIGPTALTGNRPAVDAMKSADLVIDMMGIDRGSEQREILEAGTRILLVKEPPEVLMRLVPTLEHKRRVTAAAARLGRARTMTVRSSAGTNLTVTLGEYPCLIQYGLADEPGRWDHWPSAFVATWPNEGTSNGTVVLDRGDTILPFKEYVRTPIALTIRDGYIRAIEGDFDATYLRDYMAQFRDPEGYAVSHLGWGLETRAHWTTLGLYDKRQTNAMEARSFAGNFMFSTGPNAEAGGNRRTPCHLDIPMRGCSLELDGEPILKDGELLPGAGEA